MDEILIKNQQKDGIFLSFSSSDPNDFSKSIKYHSIFSTSLILSCLNKIPQTPKIKKIKDKAAKFLLSQKSPYWSFNYWKRDSKEAKVKPYPDDLDDTFVALSALFEFNPTIFDGKALAKIVSLLTTCEEKVGGPYRTWLVDDKADEVWKDVDLAVNSNIAYFLSLQEISLPNLNKFIEGRIKKEDFSSAYYPSRYPVIYFISRFYKGKYIKNIVNLLVRDAGDSQLEKALSISTLLNFNYPPKKLKKLINQLKIPGKAFGFCIDPKVDGKKYYSGSESLTTAFCLEALAKYGKEIASLSTVARNDEEKHIYNQIVKAVKKRFSETSYLKKEALLALEKVLKMEKSKRITLLPYFFSSALSPNLPKCPNSLLVNLGMANLYGWIAYTIYDNFLDEEGNPKDLPVANFCLRELTTIFTTLLPQPSEFPQLFHKIMDELEEANIWEVTHSRTKNKIPSFGDYSQLAQKSLGHALGPLAILCFLGYSPRSKEIKYTLDFFKHFIIAKQLNDDAHDWEEDLKKGHINSVGAKILKITQDEKKLQEIFWTKILIDICKDILRQTNLARLSIRKLDIFNNFLIFEQILSPIEQAAQEALREREKTFQFLKSFKTGKGRLLHSLKDLR